jgi:hypothetical protein
MLNENPGSLSLGPNKYPSLNKVAAMFMNRMLGKTHAASQLKNFSPVRKLVGLVSMLFTLSLMTSELHAGTIFLSGDNGITHYINTQGRIGPEHDNSAFFQNVLGDGTDVSLLHTGSIFGPNDASITLDLFYSKIDDVSVTYDYPGDISPASLSGIDIFFSVTPRRSFTDSEVSALRSFLDWGGTVFLMADLSEGPRIVNDLLLALGSSLSVIGPVQTGFQIATGDQIAADPFMDGVSQFYYNAGYSLELNQGTGLVFSDDGDALVAYESIGVPEPATVTLVILAMLGFSGLRQRA